MSDTIAQELRDLHTAIGSEPTTERKAWTLMDGVVTLLKHAVHVSKAGEMSDQQLAPFQELLDALSEHHGNLAAAVATRETAPVTPAA